MINDTPIVFYLHALAIVGVLGLVVGTVAIYTDMVWFTAGRYGMSRGKQLALAVGAFGFCVIVSMLAAWHAFSR